MHIVAIAWTYVVSMMAITESSVIAGFITLTVYGLIPLGLIWFIARRIKRRFVAPPAPKNPEQNSSKTEEKKEMN